MTWLWYHSNIYTGPLRKGVSMASERGMVCEIDRIGKIRLVDIHAAGFGFGLVLVIS